jgi:cyclic-di-AMP phosphodiesterase PgpH
MKSKADGWLYVIGVLGIAGVLFLPVPHLDVFLHWPRTLEPSSFVPALAWLLAAAGFWGFRVRFWPKSRRECRRFRNCALLLLLQAILLRLVFELVVAYKNLPPFWLPKDAWVWVPWFLIPGLTGMLLGGRFGVVVCLSGALMLYLIGDPGPWPLVGCMISPLAGILLLRRSPTRIRVLRAGTGGGVTVGIVAASYYGIHEAPAAAISAAFLVPFSIGFLGAFVVLAVLPVLEWMLGELSDVTLIEYGTDHRLLDQLRTQAPGTWCHSLNVADLAEKAAAEIGARALFCKTASLYHDIGKLKEPALFAENNDGPSPHDQLEPQVSAQKIIEHVSYGVELARRHRLPKPFREIIREHHGTSVVRFFYAKACQPLPDGSQPPVDRALFCYAGPPPSTRESGIIALADVVEAASRSFSSRSEPDLRAFVRNLVAERISEGELAECPLTLSDLAKVESAFVQWLRGRNHFRPSYPGTVTEAAAVRLADAERRSASQPA